MRVRQIMAQVLTMKDSKQTPVNDNNDRITLWHKKQAALWARNIAHHLERARFNHAWKSIGQSSSLSNPR